MKIVGSVKRGKNKGTSLRPHRYADGSYVVSKTRFEKDYVKVQDLEDVVRMIDSGYKLRMSNPDAGITVPSLIAREFIFVTPA